MTFPQVRKYLESFVNYEAILDKASPYSFELGRVEHLLSLLGSPHKKIKVIHVAGTKGKGSTSAFIAHILREAGYKVGLYTSPHIHDVRERIRVLQPGPFRSAGRNHRRDLFPDCISARELSGLVARTKPTLEKMRAKKEHGGLTYFEVLTALAFCYFYQEKADYVVLETGLGGRLDATNAADALACAITPISLDHTRQLGKTIFPIAREKAAIIKSKDQIVVVGRQPKEALKVIQQRCQAVKATAYFVGKDIKVCRRTWDEEGQVFSVRGIHGKEYVLKTNLLGRYQCENTATAVGLAEALTMKGAKVAGAAVRRGIAKTFWPGRFEVIHRRPFIVLDAAHNPASARELARTVKEVFPRKKIILVFGVSQDKDREGIGRFLSCLNAEIILTRAKHRRAYPLSEEEGRKLFRTKKVWRTSQVSQALNLALTKAKKDDVILVTGSIFLVGEVREEIEKSKRR